MIGLDRVYLTVHTPRYCTYEAAFAGKLAHPDFKAVRDGLVEQGKNVAAAAPDVKAPELIHGVAYDFPGDDDLAATLIERGQSAGLQCTLANDVHYPLDYGTVMPLVCYLDRAQQIPAVPVSVCLAADLDEAFAWGRLIAKTTRDLGRRAAFAASGSVSHKLVRGPEKWPLRPSRSSITGWPGCWPTASTSGSGNGCPSTSAPPSRRWADATW